MSETAECRTSSRRGSFLALAAVLVVAAGTISLMHARGRVPWNSDAAIVDLMAQDIAHRGARPVFFDGSQYAGTFEQFCLAAVFRILPETVTTQHVAIAAMLLAVIGLVWLFTKEAFGPGAALAAGLYLALGPPFLFYRELLSEGPYTPLFLFGASILLVLLRIEARSLSSRPAGPELAALGFLGGLSWWTHPLTLVFAACAITALVVGKARKRLTVASVAGLLAATVLGAAPWLVRNIHSGWASLVGSEAAPASAFHFREQLHLMARTAIPTLMGARSVQASQPPFPGSTSVAYGVLAVIIAFGVLTLAVARAPLRRYAAAVLLTLIVVTPILSLTAARSDLQDPRLLTPLYLAIAPLFGAFVSSPWINRWLRGGSCAVVLGLHLVGHATAARLEPPPAALVQGLRERGVRTIYASYWTAYRVTFLSGRDIVGTPFGSWNLTRRQGDRAVVDGSPAPAFVLDGEEADRFETFLTAQKLSPSQDRIGGFVVFRGVSGDALARLRACKCIPGSPRRVVWLATDGPRRIPSGSMAVFHVRIRNDSFERWSPQMHLSYHWIRPDGTVLRYDGLRTGFPSPAASGETVDASVNVEANVPRGKSTLVIDVVEEGVAWFGDLGVVPPRYEVEIF